MKYALTVLATLAVLGLGALAFPFTGLMNVAATAGHTGIEQWYLSTMSRRSIQARAGDVVVPAVLADSATVARGAFAYREMCQTCHGGPDVERSVTGEGITPTPPYLHEDSTRWQPNEVFWIVQNGIKMAGMPAYGPTHTDEELWEIVAFVKQLPEMTPERYATLTAPDDASAADASAADASTTPLADDGHDHVH